MILFEPPKNPIDIDLFFPRGFLYFGPLCDFITKIPAPGFNLRGISCTHKNKYFSNWLFSLKNVCIFLISDNSNLRTPTPLLKRIYFINIELKRQLWVDIKRFVTFHIYCFELTYIFFYENITSLCLHRHRMSKK